MSAPAGKDPAPPSSPEGGAGPSAPADGPARPCPCCHQAPGPQDDLATCALCGLVYHHACATRQGHCRRAECPNRRPSHPRWTRESRDPKQGLWLLLVSPPVPTQLKLVLSVLAPPVAVLGANPCMVLVLIAPLMQAFPDVPRWALAAAAVAFVTVPSLALCLAVWHQYLQYRPALLDEKGVLLGHTSKWSGSRVAWEQLEGYKIRPRGVELVLKGRPWTRWFLAPMLPCEERLQHDVTVLLEQRGIVSAEG
jgi:hypothetical protein